ncbi:concanavalin A-like lectin/glucanase domain-containing protein, partial [Amylocarpus encephaloides]
GFNFTTKNVVSNPILDANNWTGPGILGRDPGVGLTVTGGIPANGFVDIGSMDSNRTDMIWGTYRASLKLTPIVGTCAAFFWYFNDSQEIDLEFLSEQFIPDNNTYPVNLVIQNEKTVQSGYVKGPDNFQVVNLPFNPATAYHEYRIDYVPGHIVFYGDGKVIHAFPGPTTPYEPGHLILTHWSNGNPTWSAGPPVSKATMSVGYVKGYFNSSSSGRRSSWAARCKDPSATSAICAIPDQVAPPDPAIVIGNSTAANGYFFSSDTNKTVNQTVYRKSSAPTTGSSPYGMSIALLGAITFLTVFL